MIRRVAFILVVACTTTEPVVMIRSFSQGLPGVKSANPEVRLQVGNDPAAGDEPVLLVEYPGPSDEMRPNPYFRPPGAKTGAPLDVSEVRAIGFAPQDQSPGQFRITGITLKQARA